MKRIIAALSLALVTSVAWALPTLKDVEAQVGQGNYAQAETMMGEVVAARPDSARAHYIYAEILAHEGKFPKASSEAARAKSLDPKLSFTDPAKFQSFENALEREQAAPARTRAAPSSPVSYAPAAAPAVARGGTPGWVWLVVLIGAAVILWRMFTRGRGVPSPVQEQYATPMGNYGPAAMNANPGMYGNGGMPMQQGQGSGLLKTGLAVGAGVAGGMLLDEMLHHRDGGVGNVAGNNAGGFGNLGGLDPDSFRPGADSAARELEDRPVDFGQGGDDWGSSGGDSFDSGGGGGSDDW